MAEHANKRLDDAREYAERIEARLAAGEAPDAIAAALGVTTGAVAKRLARWGARDLARPFWRERQRRKADRCGTDRGYRVHRQSGEEACPACAEAHRDYQDAYRERVRANGGMSLSGRDAPDPYAALASAIGTRDTGWMRDALCTHVDPEIFFPQRGEPNDTAKGVCAQCPARLPCLQAALDANEQWGIWGGLSRRERRQLKRGRAA